jgi:hypothetical protein
MLWMVNRVRTRLSSGVASRLSAILAAIGVALVPSHASADPVVGEVSLVVAVGGTASINVGFARGLQCDDLTMIRPDLRADTETSNRFFVTGLRPGTTQCRVGTTGPPTVLVHIEVKRN